MLLCKFAKINKQPFKKKKQERCENYTSLHCIYVCFRCINEFCDTIRSFTEDETAAQSQKKKIITDLVLTFPYLGFRNLTQKTLLFL